MNASQKGVVRVASVVSAIMLIYPPFRALRYDQPLKYDLFLAVFEKSSWNISIMDLTIQLALVWGVSTLLIAALRPSK